MWIWLCFLCARPLNVNSNWTHNWMLILTVPHGVQLLTQGGFVAQSFLRPCMRQVNALQHHMLSNPLKEKMDHCPFASSCHAAPFPLSTIWLPQWGVPELLSPLSPPVRCLRDEICPGHVWPESLSVVLSRESSTHTDTHQAEQTKPRTEEAHQTVLQA